MRARFFLVEEGANPSSDYFVLPALRRMGAEVVRCGFADVPAPAELAGASVVFVRYIPAPWRRQLSAQRSRLQGLYFFMDDDLLDAGAAAGMPWRYRFKLARLATRHRGWLRRQRAKLWVSSPWLQQKYADWQPELLPPMPLEPGRVPLRVFYHGSASHAAEVRWLFPVLEEVQRQAESVAFEIVGDRGVNRLYRRLPRVTVVHPMRWSAYQVFLQGAGRDVGLAPQLELPFNQARSYTKFFDITRCGAVGVYAAGSAAAGVVRDGEHGLVVPMDQSAWVEAILRLAEDGALRERLWSGAQGRVRELSEDAAVGDDGGNVD